MERFDIDGNITELFTVRVNLKDFWTSCDISCLILGFQVSGFRFQFADFAFPDTRHPSGPEAETRLRSEATAWQARNQKNAQF